MNLASTNNPIEHVSSFGEDPQGWLDRKIKLASEYRGGSPQDMTCGLWRVIIKLEDPAMALATLRKNMEVLSQYRKRADCPGTLWELRRCLGEQLTKAQERLAGPKDMEQLVFKWPRRRLNRN